MHIVFDLSGMLLVIVLGSSLMLCILHRLANWSQHRLLQVLVLLMPVMSLVVEIGGAYHVANRCCALPLISWDPPWDHTLDIVTLAVLAAMLLGAGSLGILRAILMRRYLTKMETITHPELQTLVQARAQQRGIQRLRVRVVDDPEPLALTYGLRLPVVLLSNWMFEQLDTRELEAVLEHEFEHVARRDYFVNWLAIILRDMFFYLPTSRIAYRQFIHEREVACDDVAVLATHQPLALASALTKMWLHRVNQPPSLVQSLTGVNKALISRIERLLGMKTPLQSSRITFLSRNVMASLGIVLAVFIANLALMWVLTVCWQASPR